MLGASGDGECEAINSEDLDKLTAAHTEEVNGLKTELMAMEDKLTKLLAEQQEQLHVAKQMAEHTNALVEKLLNRVC
eukprot:SAG22_NODE_765_length_7393_cov_5.670003_5_plen_77_part_00